MAKRWMCSGQWLTSGLAAVSLSAAGLAAKEEAPNEPLDYAIVVTGGEVLRGVYADAHTALLARLLRPLGMNCVVSICVDDLDQDIQGALAFGAARAPLILITGGLGPTDDDITRETVAAWTGIRLREEPELVEVLTRRFGVPAAELRPNVRRQALAPERGGWLRNPNGTAAGLVFDDGERVVVALPGPPRELQAMARNELLPLLERRFGIRSFPTTVTLRFVGVGESLIDHTLHTRIELPPGLQVSSIFEGGRVDLTLGLSGETPGDQSRLETLVGAIGALLGDHIYSTLGLSLEDVVLEGLHRRGGDLLVVEGGSGGILAAALLERPESRGRIRGALSAPDLASLQRLLPGAGEVQTAPTTEGAVRAVAGRALGGSGATWVLATGEVEEPDADGGARRLWVAFGREDRLETRRFAMRGSGVAAQAGLVTDVLDWIRRGPLAGP